MSDLNAYLLGVVTLPAIALLVFLVSEVATAVRPGYSGSHECPWCSWESNQDYRSSYVVESWRSFRHFHSRGHREARAHAPQWKKDLYAHVR